MRVGTFGLEALQARRANDADLDQAMRDRFTRSRHTHHELMTRTDAASSRRRRLPGVGVCRARGEHNTSFLVTTPREREIGLAVRLWAAYLFAS